MVEMSLIRYNQDYWLPYEACRSEYTHSSLGKSPLLATLTCPSSLKNCYSYKCVYYSKFLFDLTIFGTYWVIRFMEPTIIVKGPIKYCYTSINTNTLAGKVQA